MLGLLRFIFTKELIECKENNQLKIYSNFKFLTKIMLVLHRLIANEC